MTELPDLASFTSEPQDDLIRAPYAPTLRPNCCGSRARNAVERLSLSRGLTARYAWNTQLKEYFAFDHARRPHPSLEDCTPNEVYFAIDKLKNAA